MKHCNKIHIHGVLDKCEPKRTGGNSPYLEVIIDCQHDVYGSVRSLAFIWGKDNCEYFTSQFKRGADVRLSGNFQQYEGRNKETRTTFNVYVIKSGEVKERKTTFIIVGEVISLKDENLIILVKIPKSENYEAKEAEYKVHVPDDVLLEAEKTPEPGQTISVKGYIMHLEDEFGEATGTQRPVVKELRFG
jgi:hypothetical protein